MVDNKKELERTYLHNAICWLMRSFYLEFSQSKNLQPMVAEGNGSNLPPLVAEISWSKNVVIMQKCKDPFEREFYIKMTKRYGCEERF